MKTYKLAHLQHRIEKDLAQQLPVGFSNLEYIAQSDTIAHLKAVKVEKYHTSKYYVIPHYKPISKCLINF